MRVRKVLRKKSSTHPVICLWDNFVLHSRSQGVHRLFLPRQKVRQHVLRVVAYRGKKCIVCLWADLLDG